MPEWLISRSTIIALAVIGGVCSLLSSWCQSRGYLTEQQATYLGKISYTCMGVSMILFVAAGLLGG